MINKYRVHEVAKDFDMQSKKVIELLAKYFDDQKKHMTALEENELDVIFETFTQENQVENFDAYFATAKQKEEKPQEKAPAESDSKKDDKKAEKVKAAGGIRNLETFFKMLEAGAERVGCSNSCEIADEYKKTL